MAEQRREAGKVGDRNHPKVSGEVNVSSSLKVAQPRTREAVAREAKVPERNLHALTLTARPPYAGEHEATPRRRAKRASLKRPPRGS